MMITVTVEQVTRLAGQALPQYLSTFETADAVLSLHAINTSALRVAHFMAQILHETGGLRILEENMNYSAKRLTEVWPSRFKTVAAARKYERNPERLANKTYGGRMGNVNPGDGWRYRGRGMIQLTGRYSYEKFGKRLGIDLAGHPELAIDPRYSLAIAASEWSAAGCNEFADADDIRRVTKAINGGYIGLENRMVWLVKTKVMWRAGE